MFDVFHSDSDMADVLKDKLKSDEPVEKFKIKGSNGGGADVKIDNYVLVNTDLVSFEEDITIKFNDYDNGKIIVDKSKIMYKLSVTYSFANVDVIYHSLVIYTIDLHYHGESEGDAKLRIVLSDLHNGMENITVSGNMNVNGFRMKIEDYNNLVDMFKKLKPRVKKGNNI